MAGGVIGGAAIAVLFGGLPWQCAVVTWLSPEPALPAPTPAGLPELGPATTPPPPPAPPTPIVSPRPERVPERVTPDKPAAPQRTVMFPDAVVIRTLDTMRSSFVRCFERARQLDPTLGKLKVLIHLDVDATGVVVQVTTDTDLPRLGNCLKVIAGQMKFPAPGQPAVVDVPLMH